MATRVNHDDSFREVRCGGCAIIFYVCRRCDRGQVYCALPCQTIKRLASNRESGRRHSKTREGRLDNASRQAAYRARKKVTDQGPIQEPDSGTVPSRLVPSVTDVVPLEHRVESKSDVQTPCVSQANDGRNSTFDDLRRQGIGASGLAASACLPPTCSSDVAGGAVTMDAAATPRCALCGRQGQFIRSGTLRWFRVR